MIVVSNTIRVKQKRLFQKAFRIYSWHHQEID